MQQRFSKSQSTQRSSVAFTVYTESQAECIHKSLHAKN